MLKEKFADDNRVQAIESFVARLDPSIFNNAYAGCGKQAVPPDLFLRVILFEIIDARPSPAQWFVDIANDDRLKFLGRFIEPARSTCYEFRDRMSKFIEKVHINFLELAILDGFLDPTQGVLDGTIVRAAGSRHQLQSETTVKQRTKELDQIVAADESQAGVEHPTLPKWVGQTPRGRKRQLERYRKSCEVIDQRLQDNLKRPKDKQLASKHVLVCPSEPEVQLSRDKEYVFGPMYNIQNLTDPESLFILVSEVFPTATDARKAGPVLDLVPKYLNKQIKEAWADAGYCSVFDIKDCTERGVELFAPFQENSNTSKNRKGKKDNQVGRDQFQFDSETNTYQCPEGHTAKHSGTDSVWRSGNVYATRHRFRVSPKHCQGCPLKAQCLGPKSKSRVLTRIEGSELLEAMKEKMATPKGKAIAQKRGQVIERTFADNKQHRGGRRFHGFGLWRAKVENMLRVLVQNLLTLYRKLTADEKPNEKPES